MKLIAAAVVLVAIQARATIAYEDAYNYPGTLVGNGANGDLAIGNAFTVNSPIAVNELGMFDPGNAAIPDGDTISVAIYQVTIASDELTSSALVGSPVTFSSVDPGTPVAGTTTSVLPVSTMFLSPGTYMVVANNYGNNGTFPYYDNGKAPAGGITANTGGGALTFGGSFIDFTTFALGGSLPNLPDWGFFDHTIPRIAAGNFAFAVVPEASAFGGAAIALLGLIYVGRSVWLKRKTVA